MKVLIMFNFLELFNASTLSEAFNVDVIEQAKSGRIHSMLISMAAATDGLILPVGKKHFDTFSADFLKSEKSPLRSKVRALTYAAAFTAIRETMGLPLVQAADWTPKPKAKKEPSSTAPSPTERIAKAPSKGVVTPAADIIAGIVAGTPTDSADLTAADKVIALIKSHIFSADDLRDILAAAMSECDALGVDVEIVEAA